MEMSSVPTDQSDLVWVPFYLLACGVLTCIIAKRKGRTWVWFFAGILLNFWGVAIILCAENKNDAAGFTYDQIALASYMKKSQFKTFTKLGPPDTKLLCNSCKWYRRYSQNCMFFEMEVDEHVASCMQYGRKHMIKQLS